MSLSEPKVRHMNALSNKNGVIAAAEAGPPGDVPGRAVGVAGGDLQLLREPGPRYDPFGRCHGILRVGAENAAPCDPVTFMEVGDAFPDGNHGSCSSCPGVKGSLLP